MEIALLGKSFKNNPLQQSKYQLEQYVSNMVVENNLTESVSKVTPRSYFCTATLSKAYQVLRSYTLQFQRCSQNKNLKSKPLQKGLGSRQGHTMTLHTYTPT